MADTFTSLVDRLSSESYGPLVVVPELLLIGLAINWCVARLQGTRGTRPLRGLLVVLLLFTLVVRVTAVHFHWARLQLLYHYFVIALAFVALAAFQPELRRAFMRVGDWGFLRHGGPHSKVIAALVQSAGYLSRNKYGALIAIQRAVDLRGFASNGTILSADVSANLLNTIFFPNSALHDLGVIIQGTRVLAANCQFPTAESDEVDASLGSRHLAAVGMSYETDALLLVVSEETGTISLADNGRLTRFLSLDDLEEELVNRLGGGAAAGRPQRRPVSSHNVWRVVRRFLVVVPLTVMIWYLADQALQMDAEGIQLELNITPEPGFQVDVTEPQPTIFTIAVSGSTRTIDQLRSDTLDRPLRVDWVLGEAYSQSSNYHVSAAGIIETLPVLRKRGVTVQKVSPPALQFTVDRVVAARMPVRADSGAVKIGEARFDPPEVQVALRARDLEKLGDADRFVVVRLDERLRRAPTNQTISLPDVALERTVGSFNVLDLSPEVVNVTLRVVELSVRRRIAGVVVRCDVSWQLWQRYNLELRDSNELLIEVEVEGEKSAIEALGPQDIHASLTVTGELEPPTPEFRPRPVTFVVPEGMRVVGPAPDVHFRLVERPSGLGS